MMGADGRRAWGWRAVDPPQASTELDEFFDLSIDLLCILGFDGYLKRVNAALARTWGIRRASLSLRLRCHASERCRADGRTRTGDPFITRL